MKGPDKGDTQKPKELKEEEKSKIMLIIRTTLLAEQGIWVPLKE
jgi:hypothetical protein